MGLLKAEKVIERAQKGERLSAIDRRFCVAYLMGTAYEATNVELATLFQVSERQIRLDRQKVREVKAQEIKDEDIGLVVADISMTFERQIRDIERSKAKCKMGTRHYLEHCKAIHDLQLKTVKAMQDLGYYPKNLGNLTVEKYEYKASVTKDMTMEARPLELRPDQVEFLALPSPEAESKEHIIDQEPETESAVIDVLEVAGDEV